MTSQAIAAVLVLVAAACVAWPAGRSERPTAGPYGGRARPTTHSDRRTVDGSGERARRDGLRRRGILATLAGVAVATLVGGLVGIVGGIGTIAAVYALLKRAEEPAQRRLREQRTAELAGSLDLFAVCLRTGLPPPRALALVAEQSDGPLAADLKTVAALQALGVPAGAAWSKHAGDPVLGQVARAVSRTADSGAALAGSVERVAAETRADARQAAEAAARRAGIAVLAPLGLCFLPAFVCLGVIPIVLGIAEDVLW